MKHIIHKATVFLTADRVAEYGARAIAFGVLYVFIRAIISL